MRYRHRLLVLFLILIAPAARADVVLLGALSYNTFVPSGGGSPGVDALDLANLTGGFDLPPDFPVSDNLTFLGSVLTLTQADLTQQVFNIGDFAPGFLLDGLGNPVIQVAGDQLFVSAEFTATLSAASFLLYDGTTFTPDSLSLDVLLLPSAGPDLMADTDQTTISATQTQAPTVPEPAGFVLFGAGAAALVIGKRRLNNLFSEE